MVTQGVHSVVITCQHIIKSIGVFEALDDTCELEGTLLQQSEAEEDGLEGLDELQANPLLIENTGDKDDEGHDDLSKIHVFESVVHPESRVISQLTVHSLQFEGSPVRSIPKVASTVQIHDKVLVSALNILIILYCSNQKHLINLKGHIEATIL